MGYSITERTVENFSVMLDALSVAYNKDIGNVKFESNSASNAKKLTSNLHQALTAAKKLKSIKYAHLRDAFKVTTVERFVVCINISRDVTKVPLKIHFDEGTNEKD